MVRISQLLYESETLFRTSFSLKNRSVLHWFPGHMGKGMKQMQQKLKSVDCVVEVHDARIPFTGRNPECFQTISGLRPHILVYNKRDLADENLETSIIDKFKAKGFQNVIFTNCKDPKCNGMRKIIPMARNLILNTQRHNRSENMDSCLMVIGVPNVGKSSVINYLRRIYLMRGSAAQVGAIPGITRSVNEKIKISDDPLIYVLDTPGILTPKVPTVDDGMKLAMCATIPDKEVGIELVADYLLFWLNKNGNFKYIDFFGVEKPCDSISELLVSFALQYNLMIKGTNVEGNWILRPNIHLAAQNFVEAFRKGLFGRLSLDVDKLQSNILERSFVIDKKARKR